MSVDSLPSSRKRRVRQRQARESDEEDPPLQVVFPTDVNTQHHNDSLDPVTASSTRSNGKMTIRTRNSTITASRRRKATMVRRDRGRRLGPADQAKVSEYLDTVREVERRIQKAESDVAKNNLPADLDRPLGVPATYTDHAKLMLDLQVLAFQGDITRVITFQLARETSNRTYAAETGVADPHHPLSHHGNDPEKIARMAKINAFHVSLFAYYLDRLKATPDGEGTLLDHTMLLYGSGIGNPNVHDHTNLPTIVAGGKAFGIKGNRHLRYNDPVPLANLHLTLLDKAGVNIDSFADSTGKVTDLFRPLTV